MGDELGVGVGVIRGEGPGVGPVVGEGDVDGEGVGEGKGVSVACCGTVQIHVCIAVPFSFVAIADTFHIPTAGFVFV